MTIEHINGIYYRNNRTEYSYGGERFQKIDKDAPEAVQRNRRLTVAERKPLAPNEWRGDVDGREKLITFSWYGNEANATSADHVLETYWAAGKPRASSRGFDAVHAALRAWASKPENLPHDVAIVNGVPYLMKDDEARTSLGRVSNIADDWKSFPLDCYDWQPGQRERVEKWRASQEKKTRTIPSVDVVVTHDGMDLFSGTVIEYSVNQDINGGPAKMSLSAIEKPKASQPKPLADDEVEIAGKTDRLCSTPFVDGGRNSGFVYVLTVRSALHPIAGALCSLKGQSLTNARNYARKHLKLAPDEYLCEESWTVKKRWRWVLNYTTTREFLGRPTRVRITETEIFPGEE